MSEHNTQLLTARNQGEQPEGNGSSTQSVVPMHLPPLETETSIMLVFADNPNALQFELTTTVVLGRRSEGNEQPDIDLAPYGAYPAGVSRRHVRLSRLRGQIYLEDMATRNGTFIQEQRTKPNEPYRLLNGQMFRLGNLKIWVYFMVTEAS